MNIENSIYLIDKVRVKSPYTRTPWDKAFSKLCVCMYVCGERGKVWGRGWGGGGERLNTSEVMFICWSEFSPGHKIHSRYIEKNGI